MADFSIQEYMNRLGGIPRGSNLEANPQQYIPQGRTVSEFNDPYGDPGRVGLFSPNTVQMNTAPMSKQFALETLMHEAAHTTQPTMPHILNGNTNKLRGIEYEGYLKKGRPTSDVDEVLADLKAKEALLPKGKSVLDTEHGRTYLDRVRSRNQMQPTEARDYITNAMYHPHVDMIKKLFQK